MKITSQKAGKLVDKGAKLVDVRSPVDFAKGTLPGAINIVLRNVSSLPSKFKKTDTLIFLGTVEDTKQFERYAEQLGYMNVHTLEMPEEWNK